MKRLVLFDIDGTLLNGGRLWREVFEAAFAGVFPGLPFPKVSFSGKTDRQICAEVLDSIGQPAHGREQLVDRLIGQYLHELATAINSGRGTEVEVLPGVTALLDALAGHPGVCLGLLTGNVLPGAKLKLSATMLDHYFHAWMGAFGDDHADRYQLPAIAVKRAHAVVGTLFQGKQVVIIGDTPHDVNCGRSIGVCAIAVGTGRPEYREALLAAGADHFFENLADTSRILKALGV